MPAPLGVIGYLAFIFLGTVTASWVALTHEQSAYYCEGADRIENLFAVVTCTLAFLTGPAAMTVRVAGRATAAQLLAGAGLSVFLCIGCVLLTIALDRAHVFDRVARTSAPE